MHFDCGAGLTFGRRLTAGRVRARQAVACLHETRHGLNGPLYESRFAHDCGINACLVRRLAFVGRLAIGRMYLAYCCNSGWLHGAFATFGAWTPGAARSYGFICSAAPGYSPMPPLMPQMQHRRRSAGQL